MKLVARAEESSAHPVISTIAIPPREGYASVGPGKVFALPTNIGHDLVNTGTETMRCVAFFAAAMFTQTFDNMMQPPNSHVIGTPNRMGEGAPPPRKV